MSIIRDYKALLANKMNHLKHQGYVTLERWELLSWYGRDRITNIIWRDINDAWCTCMESDEPGLLLVIKCDETTTPQKYVVVKGDSLLPIEDLS